MLFNLKRSNP